MNRARILETPVSRRGFSAGCLGAAAAIVGGGAEAGVATADATEVLADYVAKRDPTTTFTPLADGVAAGGRWRTGRLVSQTWRERPWTHELSLFLPDDARATGRALLWIDGGSEGKLPPADLRGPTDSVRTLTAVATAAGLPAAVVRQVPFQPMFNGLHEDGLIAHTFVEYARTGDASWPLLLPMVKAAVEAMTAVTGIAKEHWNVAVDEFVVTGASKRGWTTWLTAAVDRRVAGIVPMVIDMLSLEDHMKLQIASFGGMSDKLHDYTVRGIDRLLATPRGRELVEIIDPYAYRDRLTMPKLIALGTNDPYWPLGALDLYYDGLPGPRWVSYAPNAGHGLPPARVGGLVAALGRHAAGVEPLPAVDWRFDADGVGNTAVVRSDARPERAVLWTASSASRDFRGARWSSQPVEGAGPEWRASIGAPASGFVAGLVELEFGRRPLPLALTSGVTIVAAADAAVSPRAP
jgi:PhoPQ-activated pathogenicity-related protein